MRYVSLSEVASRLKKSERTIKLWISKGITQPVNKDTFRRDGGYRFTEEECQRLEKIYGQIFLSKAANIVGITPQYLNQLAIDQVIPSELKIVGQQKRRVFKRNDLKRLKRELQHNQHSKKTYIYGKPLFLQKNNLCLFDTFFYHGEMVRVLNTEPVQIVSENGAVIRLNGIQMMSDPIENVPYQRKKGFIEFRYPIPHNIHHQLYETLFKIFHSFGPRNIKIFEQKDGNYFIRCRQGEFDGTDEDYAVLKSGLQKGKVVREGQRIKLKTGKKLTSTYLSEEVIESIVREASHKNVSFEHALEHLIVKGLSQSHHVDVIEGGINND